jgi:hypothetical protein
MQYKQIIKDAWSFAQANKQMMKWYALLPSIFSIIVGIVFVAYQYFSFKNKAGVAAGQENKIFLYLTEAWNFLQNHPSYIWILVLVAIIGIFFYFFYPTFSQGAMIQLIARKKNGQETRLVDGISYGLSSFLPMFEYHLLIRSFSLTAVFTQSVFVLRNLGSDVLFILLPFFVIVAIAGVFLTLFFTFVEWFIAIDDEGVLSALQKSSKLVLKNLQHTFFVLVLLLIIGIRILINIILVFLVPILVFAIVGLFASTLFKGIAIAIGVCISLLALYIAGYLGGTLSVFFHAVWTFVFLELTEKNDSAREVTES